MVNAQFCRSLVFLLSVVTFSIASAQEGQTTVFTNYGLLSDAKPVGAITKFHHLLIQAVLGKADVTYELISAPAQRAYQLTQRTPNSLLYAIVRTPENESALQWVGELNPTRPEYFLYQLASRDDLDIVDLDSARSYRVGVLQADKFRRFFERNGFESLDPVNSSRQNYEKLLLGRIDVIAESSVAINSTCTELKIDCSQFKPILKIENVSQGVFLAASLDSTPEFIETITVAFDAIVSDGTYRRLIQPLCIAMNMEDVCAGL